MGLATEWDGILEYSYTIGFGLFLLIGSLLYLWFSTWKDQGSNRKKTNKRLLATLRGGQVGVQPLRVAVVVNGDIRQSPRTWHHVEMLAGHVFEPAMEQSLSRSEQLELENLQKEFDLQDELGADETREEDGKIQSMLTDTVQDGKQEPYEAQSTNKGENNDKGKPDGPRDECKFRSQVFLFSYGRMPEQVINREFIEFHEIHSLKAVLKNHGKLVYILTSIRATVSRAWDLLKSLWNVDNLDLILVQNPPSIPTLFIVFLVIKLKHNDALFAIDWHNFGFTIMQTTNAPWVLVQVAKVYEKYLGQCADIHFCVSQAMKRFLLNNWNIQALVFYDMPSWEFRERSIIEQHELFVRLQTQYGLPLASSMESGKMVVSNSFLERDQSLKRMNGGRNCSRLPILTQTLRTFVTSEDEGSIIELRADRPFLCVSGSSWTPDEDFRILLDALAPLDEKLADSRPARDPYATDSKEAPPASIVLSRTAKLVIIITGKGPLQQQFLADVNRLDLKHILVLTVWLEREDYPILLGCADLGISLHASSSGMDLPMKVVDMFGSGLPVASIRYTCIEEELIEENLSGFFFSSAGELANILSHVVDGFPKGKKSFRDPNTMGMGKLNSMRRYLQARYSKAEMRADGNWTKVVGAELTERLLHAVM